MLVFVTTNRADPSTHFTVLANGTLAVSVRPLAESETLDFHRDFTGPRSARCAARRVPMLVGRELYQGRTKSQKPSEQDRTESWAEQIELGDRIRLISHDAYDTTLLYKLRHRPNDNAMDLSRQYSATSMYSMESSSLGGGHAVCDYVPSKSPSRGSAYSSEADMISLACVAEMSTSSPNGTAGTSVVAGTLLRSKVPGSLMVRKIPSSINWLVLGRCCVMS